MKKNFKGFSQLKLHGDDDDLCIMMKHLCVTKKDHFLTLCHKKRPLSHFVSGRGFRCVPRCFKDILTSKQCDGYAVNHLFAILIRVSHKKKKTFSRRSVGAHSAEEQTLSQRFPNRF